MSNLISTIEQASSIAGSQAELARRLGVPATHVSGWKKGRPCSARMRALVADAAGEDVAQAVLEGLLETAERTGDQPLAKTLRTRLKNWGRNL